jgi:hypothetical protein
MITVRDKIHERFIYSQNWSTYFPAADSGNICINRSQTHDRGNSYRAIPFLGIFVLNFGIVSLQCGWTVQ